MQARPRCTGGIEMCGRREKRKGVFDGPSSTCIASARLAVQPMFDLNRQRTARLTARTSLCSVSTRVARQPAVLNLHRRRTIHLTRRLPFASPAHGLLDSPSHRLPFASTAHGSLDSPSSICIASALFHLHRQCTARLTARLVFHLHRQRSLLFASPAHGSPYSPSSICIASARLV